MPPTHPFTHLKARQLLGQFLLIVFGVGFMLGLFANQLPVKTTDPIMVLVLYIAIFSLLALWNLRRFRRWGGQLADLVGQVPPHHPWGRTAGLVVAMLLFSLGAFYLSFYGLSLVAPAFVQKMLNGLPTNAPQTAFPVFHRILMGITIVIVAPVTEEFIFRGILLQRWTTKWGIRTALILSSLLFGALHANILGLSVFGLIMGVLYIQTRSLLVPMAAHSFNNAIAFAMTFVPSPAAKTSLSLANLHANLGPGIILVTLSAPWIVWFLRKNFPRKNAFMPYLVNANHNPAKSD